MYCRFERNGWPAAGKLVRGVWRLWPTAAKMGPRPANPSINAVDLLTRLLGFSRQIMVDRNNRRAPHAR